MHVVKKGKMQSKACDHFLILKEISLYLSEEYRGSICTWENLAGIPVFTFHNKTSID